MKENHDGWRCWGKPSPGARSTFQYRPSEDAGLLGALHLCKTTDCCSNKQFARPFVDFPMRFQCFQFASCSHSGSSHHFTIQWATSYMHTNLFQIVRLRWLSLVKPIHQPRPCFLWCHGISAWDPLPWDWILRVGLKGGKGGKQLV